MKDISIDIETMSTFTNAAVLSIGATAFDRDSGQLGHTTRIHLGLGRAIEGAGHISASTLSWWMRQSYEAREAILQGDCHVEKAALELLHCFLRTNADDTDVRVWGNGSSFDITILESMHQRCGMGAPWKHWNVRDMRTLVDAAEGRGFQRGQIEFDGVKHDAGDDSRHQAKVIAAAWATLQRAG